MSISSNYKRERRKKASSALSCPSAFIIASILLAGGFVLVGTTTTTATTPMTAAFAQEGNNTTTTTTSQPSSNTTTTTTNTSSGIELSPQPVLQERATTLSMTPINQTHSSATFSGNGTFTLPNTTETVNFTVNGSALISLMTQSAQAKETIMTEEGETATGTFYAIQQFDPATGEGKGITIAVIHTDSTGTLAPLDGMILAGTNEEQPNGESSVTLWEWESGISNNAGVAPPSMQEEESQMNTTTTTT
jgi:hypothetical protein